MSSGEACYSNAQLSSQLGLQQRRWECEREEGWFLMDQLPVAPHHLDPTLLYGFVATDYHSAAALWLQQGVHKALNIFSRSSSAGLLPDLQAIGLKLTEICGPQAANISSGVYNRVCSYDHVPTCFAEGLWG
ncbi:uncharacterized protein LOC143291829 [Babylonia areolata]|uniref:uncharacterized protein LOC143291829 n=1 Tax=Babylonia areolata TaxID=304850 RepID=UPI003FD1D40C